MIRPKSQYLAKSRTMVPGPKLDRFVARWLMGWKHFAQNDCACTRFPQGTSFQWFINLAGEWQPLPSFSTTIEAAWWLVTRMRAAGFHFELSARAPMKDNAYADCEWRARFGRTSAPIHELNGIANSWTDTWRASAQHAICIAALETLLPDVTEAWTAYEEPERYVPVATSRARTRPVEIE